MSRYLSGTWMIWAAGAVQIVRATLCQNVAAYGQTFPYLFVRAGGSIVDFDPSTAVYLTSDMVQNLAAKHGIRISGDTLSALRMSDPSVKHVWKQAGTLEQACAHPYLGKTMPSPKAIIDSYAAYAAAVRAAEGS